MSPRIVITVVNYLFLRTRGSLSGTQPGFWCPALGANSKFSISSENLFFHFKYIIRLIRDLGTELKGSDRYSWVCNCKLISSCELQSLCLQMDSFSMEKKICSHERKILLLWDNYSFWPLSFMEFPLKVADYTMKSSSWWVSYVINNSSKIYIKT